MKNKEIRSNNNIVFNCKFHVIWCVKYRKQLLVGELEERLKEICKEVCIKRDAILIEMECDKDHIHLLIDVDPQYGIHRLVKEMKGLSSRLIRQEFSLAKTRVPSLWTNSYFVSTVGSVSLEKVKTYIENQKTTYDQEKKVRNK